jgi:hypothetical protein
MDDTSEPDTIMLDADTDLDIFSAGSNNSDDEFNKSDFTDDTLEKERNLDFETEDFLSELIKTSLLETYNEIVNDYVENNDEDISVSLETITTADVLSQSAFSEL